MVVEVLVFGEGSAGCGDGEFAGVEVPELDAGAVVGSFDAAIELRSSGRQDKLRDVELLASLLELGPELLELGAIEGHRQVIDLDELAGLGGPSAVAPALGVALVEGAALLQLDAPPAESGRGGYAPNARPGRGCGQRWIH